MCPYSTKFFCNPCYAEQSRLPRYKFCKPFAYACLQSNTNLLQAVRKHLLFARQLVYLVRPTSSKALYQQHTIITYPLYQPIMLTQYGNLTNGPLHELKKLHGR